mmetsp:Transcript_86440/g.180979  ORF Transcript_86440/g.180979 Transcript_86440/m.180979 type:complete len:210 (+) Transcript_86440:3005-3634(+)
MRKRSGPVVTLTRTSLMRPRLSAKLSRATTAARRGSPWLLQYRWRLWRSPLLRSTPRRRSGAVRTTPMPALRRTRTRSERLSSPSSDGRRGSPWLRLRCPKCQLPLLWLIRIRSGVASMPTRMAARTPTPIAWLWRASSAARRGSPWPPDPLRRRLRFQRPIPIREIPPSAEPKRKSLAATSGPSWNMQPHPSRPTYEDNRLGRSTRPC